MPLSDVASVTITTASANATAAGFGTPLIVSASTSATWLSAELVRTYSDSAAVLADFASTTPEYKSAVALFSQNPRPEQVRIGRLSDDPAMVYVVGLVAATNGVEYTFQLNDTDISFTSVDADNDNIITGIVNAITTAAISGISAASTGSIGSKVCTITGTAGTFVYPLLQNGEGVSTGPDGQNLFTLAGTGAEPGTTWATQLGAINTEQPDWYALINPYYSKANALAIAAWVESNDKLYIQATPDTEIITVASASATDIAETTKDTAYARTAILYHHIPEQFADAAWFGKNLPKAPGSITWAFKELNAVTVSTFTATHLTNLRAKNCNYYYPVAGLNWTHQGKVAADEWLDIVRGRDWLKARLQERIATLLSNADKIPFTDVGVALVEAQVRAQLRDGIAANFIAENPAPTVTVPKVADVSSANKDARLLPDVNFVCTAAGAIHKIVITGTILI